MVIRSTREVLGHNSWMAGTSSGHDGSWSSTFPGLQTFPDITLSAEVARRALAGGVRRSGQGPPVELCNNAESDKDSGAERPKIVGARLMLCGRGEDDLLRHRRRQRTERRRRQSRPPGYD